MQVIAVFLGYHLKTNSKEDPSRRINCFAFLKRLIWECVGYEISGLELKFWSSSMDTGKVKEDWTTTRTYCHSADLVALFSTELFVCFGSGEQKEVFQLEK